MVTPACIARGRFGCEQGLAAQHAMLVGKGEAHNLELFFFDDARDLRCDFCLRTAPQLVAVYEGDRTTRTRGHYGLVPIGPARSPAFARFALLPITLPVVGRADAINRRRARDARGSCRIEDHDRLLTFAEPMVHLDPLVRIRSGVARPYGKRRERVRVVSCQSRWSRVV